MDEKLYFTLRDIIILMVVGLIIFIVFGKQTPDKFVGAISSHEYREFLVRWEGYKDVPYRDSMGNWTAGIGHLLKPSDKFAQRYDDRQIDDWFYADLSVAKIGAESIFGDFESHPKNVKLVLISLSFNLGETKLRKFPKFVAAINRKDYSNAARELRDSKWYKQVGDRGFHHVLALGGEKCVRN